MSMSHFNSIVASEHNQLCEFVSVDQSSLLGFIFTRTLSAFVLVLQPPGNNKLYLYYHENVLLSTTNV